MMLRPSKLGFQHVFVNRLSHNASFGAFNSQFQEFMTLHLTNLLFVFLPNRSKSRRFQPSKTVSSAR